MTLTDLITREAILPSMRVATKKQALQELSERASGQCGLPAREIYDALLQRERLGSTGIGNGIAIPHGRAGESRANFRRVRADRKARSISKRSMAILSISFFFWWRLKTLALITSRRSRAPRACSARRTRQPSSARLGMPA